MFQSDQLRVDDAFMDTAAGCEVSFSDDSECGLLIREAQTTARSSSSDNYAASTSDSIRDFSEILFTDSSSKEEADSETSFDIQMEMARKYLGAQVELAMDGDEETTSNEDSADTQLNTYSCDFHCDVTM